MKKQFQAHKKSLIQCLSQEQENTTVTDTSVRSISMKSKMPMGFMAMGSTPSNIADNADIFA